jgi:hypothetical protein
MVHADVGISSGHCQLLAAGHIHQQLSKQRGVGRRCDQWSSRGLAVRVGHIRAAYRLTDLNVDSKVDLFRSNGWLKASGRCCLPPEMAAFEPAASWEHWEIFFVLSAWRVGGLVACLAAFRWSDKN